MNYKDKLESIMNLLSIEMYEIDRAVDQQESYESITGQLVSSVDASLTFAPIYEAVEKIYKQKDSSESSNSGLCGMSFR